MTDGTQAGGGAGAEDPWAPPGSRPSLEKNTSDPAQSPGPGQAPGFAPPAFPPPSVHDQETMVSMPGAGFPPPGYGGPTADSAVPPPPVAPTGPGIPTGPVPDGYGYPAYPGAGQGWPGMPMPPQNGMGTAAMVLGILSCTMFCFYGIFGVVLGVLAVIFGIKGRRKAERGEANNHGQAQAGLITGIIGIVLGLATIVLLVIGVFYVNNVEVSSDSTWDEGARAPLPAVTVLTDR
ncbi:DUF4190 domain-containing protein [Streptomyces sp. 6-11-2]|uniref:DUF4190 domain-containing protein n=1 Tax=Streptomyces sp. 6-11-2 TaxID=2585753 RepID=UPI001144F5E6|nr:DUF4190 domain-containing protein [Streptomyces sp. 6-11-2]GED84454.1 hypothetical protein TNCT6_15390 [Streptomyces sp. 6-11-2]